MRIVFTGAHSTGKTTLLKELNLVQKGFTEMPNLRRHLKDIIKLSINSDVSYGMQYANAIWHLYNISVNENVISDRSIIDVIAYTQASTSISSKQKREFTKEFLQHINLEDVIFYTPIEFDIVQDGARSTDNKYRELIDRNIKTILLKNKIKYCVLKGTVQERLKTIEEYISTK